MGLNVGQFVRSWAVAAPARTALVLLEDSTRREVSYAELDERASRVAATLARDGLVAGDRVALLCPNGLAFVEAFFGCLYGGMSVLPLPPTSAPPEIAFRLAHARVSRMLAHPSLASLADAGLEGTNVRKLDASTLAGAQDRVDGPRDLDPATHALLLYTSGTTGTPKAAAITHASLATHTAALVCHALSLTSSDVVLATLPLSHSYGIRMTLLAPFYAGARSVLLERFVAARVRSTLVDERVSWFPGVPTMWSALGREPPLARDAVAPLRSCLSAGAPLASEVRTRAESVLGVRIREAYGLTEATISTLDASDDGAGTVGRPVFGVEVRIVDEHGAELPRGARGEITIRGQNVMAGYLDDEASTRATIRDGWVHTGDVGLLDDAGRLVVVDRIKDLVIRSGFNVVPAEVEAALLTHGDVREAVVVGLPDPHVGEEVVAVVVLEPGVELDPHGLDVHCRARLGTPKVPRLYAAIDAMPLGPSGKIKRADVREAVRSGACPLFPARSSI